MLPPYSRQQIENWVGDFCSSDAVRGFASDVRDQAAGILTKFIVSACEIRDVEPGDLEESDLKAALLGPVAKLNLGETVKSKVLALCGAMLGHMESEGRLSVGRLLGAYVRALHDAFEDRVREGVPFGKRSPAAACVATKAMSRAPSKRCA